MVKRTLSFLLSVFMVIGLVPMPHVQATQSCDVIYVDSSTSISELVENGIVHMEHPQKEISAESTGSQSPVRDEQPQEIVSPVATLCDCGQTEADIYSHSDNCALRGSCHPCCKSNFISRLCK